MDKVFLKIKFKEPKEPIEIFCPQKYRDYYIRGQIIGISDNFYEDGCKTLELSNRLYSMYVKANYGEKAKILKAVASNYTINDVTITPTYRKPFSLFAKRASHPNWLPVF